MRSCIISGVPRIIQTKVLVSALTGLNFDIEPNEIISPRGRAPTRVIANSRRVTKKPSFSASITMGSCWDSGISLSAFKSIVRCINRQRHPPEENRADAFILFVEPVESYWAMIAACTL